MRYHQTPQRAPSGQIQEWSPRLAALRKAPTTLCPQLGRQPEEIARADISQVYIHAGD